MIASTLTGGLIAVACHRRVWWIGGGRGLFVDRWYDAKEQRAAQMVAVAQAPASQLSPPSGMRFGLVDWLLT